MPGIKIGIAVKDQGYDEFVKLVDRLKSENMHVRVGVLEGTPGGDEVRGNEGIGNQAIGTGRIGVAQASAGITNAALAAIHEFGSADGRIPERSFLRSTFNANRDTYLDMLAKLLMRVVEGKATVEQAFGIVGAKFAADIKRRVTQGAEIPPPNAPSTLARKIGKHAFGRNGLLKVSKWMPRTLVDTGRMINAITWLVRRGNSDE